MPTEKEIDRVVAGYNRAIEATAYAQTIACEVDETGDEPYPMVWSTLYNGGFAPNA